jgi:hypothetical protein
MENSLGPNQPDLVQTLGSRTGTVNAANIYSSLESLIGVQAGVSDQLFSPRFVGWTTFLPSKPCDSLASLRLD